MKTPEDEKIDQRITRAINEYGLWDKIRECDYSYGHLFNVLRSIYLENVLRSIYLEGAFDQIEASQSKPQEIPEENRQKLFNHMSTEHGLTLLESEMNSIYSICIGHEEYVKYLNWLHSKPVDTKTVDAVEWISVKEKLWDRYQAVWATDGKTIDRICTGNIEGTLKIYSDITHWTPIIKPNLP